MDLEEGALHGPITGLACDGGGGNAERPAPLASPTHAL